MTKDESFCQRMKFLVTGSNFLLEEDIPSQRKKISVIGRLYSQKKKFIVTGRNLLSEGEILF